MEVEESPNEEETPTTVNIPLEGTSGNQVNSSCTVNNVSNQTVVQGPQYNIGSLILSNDPVSSSTQSTQTEITENAGEGVDGTQQLADNNEDHLPGETGQDTMPFAPDQDLEEANAVNPSSDSSNNLVTSSESENEVNSVPTSSSINIAGSNNVVVLIHGSDNKLHLPEHYAAHHSTNRDNGAEMDERDDEDEIATGSNVDDRDATDDGRPPSQGLSLSLLTKDVNSDKLQLGEDLTKIASQDSTPTPDSAPIYPFTSAPVAYSHASTVYSPTHTTDSNLSGSDGIARLSAIDESEVPSPMSTDDWMSSDTSTIASSDNRSYSPTTPVQSDPMSGPSTPDADNPPDSPGETETPWEIMVRGEQAQEAYMRACRLGTKKVYRTRLMLVGQERVGKTSLLKSLIGKEHDQKEEITDGVDTTTSCKVPMSDCTLPWEVQHSDKKDRVQHVSSQYNQAVGSSMAQQLLEMSQDGEDVMTTQDNSQKVEKHVPVMKTPESSLEMDLFEENISHNYDDPKNFELSQSPSKIIVPREISDKALQTLNQGSPMHGGGMLQNSNVDSECVLEFQLWDFAGQDIYYTTHQVFLNRRAIFVLVYDASQDLQLTSKVEECCEQGKKKSRYHNFTGLDFLHYWLQSVYTYAAHAPTAKSPNQPKQPYCTPPVFVVGTHRDSLVPPSGTQTHKTDNEQHQIIYSAIAGKPYEKHVLRQFHMVENSLSNTMDPKLVELRRQLADVALKEPYMGENIPVRWLQFEKAVMEAVANNTTHMKRQEVRDLAKTFKIRDYREFSTMLQFFHDLGCIVYFGRDERGRHKQALRDIVVLDPQWLIDVFKRIITVKPNCKQWSTFSNHWQRLRDDGILDEELIDHVWEDLQHLKATFISLMEMFDLLCPQCIPSKDGKQTEETKTYYVPACLQPNTKHTSDTDVEEEATLYVDFEEFLPDGLFHRVLVHFARWSQEESHRPPKLHYRHGTFYVGTQKNKHIVELYMRPSNPACIKVMIRRPTVVSKHRKREAPCQACPQVCSQVQIKLESILDIVKQTWVHGIQYSFKVVCEACCNPGMASSGDSSGLHLLCFHECTHAEIDTVFCTISDCDVDTEIYRKRFKFSDSGTKETNGQTNQNSTGDANNEYSESR